MTTHDPRAWRVAIALGLESGLDWSRWAAGLTAPAPKRPAWMGDGQWDSTRPDPTPVPAPWHHAAYVADCHRRGVEPGPLPSLERGNIYADKKFKDGRVEWSITATQVLIRVGRADACLRYRPSDCELFAGKVRISLTSAMLGVDPNDFAVAARMVAAAAKAMVGP